MKKQNSIYLIITFLFIAISMIILSNTNFNDSVLISNSFQIILILYLIRVAYGCALYIKYQYKNQKYTYSIILNLGLLIFINLNIIRMLILLMKNFHTSNISSIYSNTLESFSYFSVLTLPCILVLSVYSILTNIILIKKESFSYRNMLGIFLGFISIIGLFGGQFIYMITNKLMFTSEQLLIKKFIDIHLNATLSYFYSLILATLYCNVMASNHNPEYNKDYVIILGSKIKDNGELTPLLKGRADRALLFGKNQKMSTNKDVIYVPSGGQGSNEIIPEAEAIKNYLIEEGIDRNKILVENKSTNTVENIRFSKKLIEKEKKNAKVAFSTTNYHVFRSGVIANNEGLDCEGMGSTTKWYFYTNALIREFIANLYKERKKHIVILILMNISLFLLTYIGFYYHLFKI